MSENYIVINGKKLELTEKQLRALGIETRRNPFERLKSDADGPYYYITEFGNITFNYESHISGNEKQYNNVNYFNDEAFAEQVALHQLLYRKLLKFAYDNECEDREKWDGENRHWFVRWSCATGNFIIFNEYYCKGQEVYFSSDEAAKRAGREVVEPFMKEHPEFVW